NVALWHERDISHSSVERIIIPDSTILLDHMLTNLEKLVSNLRVFPERMKANLQMTHGLIHSQQVLLLLTEKGFSREEAYRLVQSHAMKSWETGADFRALVESDEVIMSRVTKADLDRVFDLGLHFRHVDRIFRAVGL
ncbi:MAG: adenylosuccinate lyase, partial [Kiritimatiellae bacterium]|nr:adenylosuccinate lyase [Kiritimatiellia bacterium]